MPGLRLYVDGSGIHVSFAPHFLSREKYEKKKKTSAQLETSGPVLRLKRKQTNKQQKWAALLCVPV